MLGLHSFPKMFHLPVCSSDSNFQESVYELSYIPGPQETILSGNGAYKNKASQDLINLASTFPAKLCRVFNRTIYSTMPVNNSIDPQWNQLLEKSTTNLKKQ